MLLETLLGAALLAKASAHPPPPPGSAIKTTVGTWQYQGCYTDFGPRILNFRFDIPEGNTAERCTQLCADNGFGIAGLEYGTECWCDNYNHFGKLPIRPDAQCNFACPGDEMEWCGAGNRLVLYENTAATPPSPNNCISWRSQYAFQNTRMQAVPKAAGLPTNLFAIGGIAEGYRLMSDCSGSCTWTDYFNFGVVDRVLQAYSAMAIEPAVGGAQALRSTWPVTFPGHAGYCAKPNPLSPWGGFTGFPLLSVNGDTDSWALCANTTAGGRRDVVYAPVAGHAQYVKAECDDVYIQILPYITDWANYGPQPS